MPTKQTEKKQKRIACITLKALIVRKERKTEKKKTLRTTTLRRYKMPAVNSVPNELTNKTIKIFFNRVASRRKQKTNVWTKWNEQDAVCATVAHRHLTYFFLFAHFCSSLPFRFKRTKKKKTVFSNSQSHCGVTPTSHTFCGERGKGNKIKKTRKTTEDFSSQPIKTISGCLRRF